MHTNMYIYIILLFIYKHACVWGDRGVGGEGGVGDLIMQYRSALEVKP